MAKESPMSHLEALEQLLCWNWLQPYNPWADQHMGIWMYVTHFNVKAELRQEWNCNKNNHNPKC